MSRRGRSLAALGLVLAALFVAPPATAAPAGAAARVVEEVRVDARTLDLTIDSPALGHTAKVRLWLPRGWDAEPARTWPALWLLHGANEPADYQSWDRFTTAKEFMAGKDVLTVMPSQGPAGCYTDEWNPLGRPGAENWETFHTVELRQILERGYRTNGRASVAGISAGGYGAMIYTARHPGMFGAAASYSGSLDIFHPLAQAGVWQTRLQAGENPLLWGSPITDRANWVAHDPTSQAGKLRGVGLYVSVGDGAPGPLDRPDFPEIWGSRAVEAFAPALSRPFTDRLRKLGIPVTTHYYHGGYHYWDYWDREFKLSWPVLERGLGGAGGSDGAAGPHG